MSDANGEALRCQLEQLNERARWYATQLWQLPLAYLGLAGVGLGGLLEKPDGAKDYLPWFLLAVLVSGFLISCHMFGLLGGIRRAVRNIRQVEEKLGLEKTAEYYPSYSMFPLIFLVLVVAVAASVAAMNSFSCNLGIRVLDGLVVAVSAALFWRALPDDKLDNR